MRSSRLYPGLRIACVLGLFVFAVLIGYSYYQPVTPRFQTRAGGYLAVAIHRGLLAVHYSHTVDRLLRRGEFRKVVFYDEGVPYESIAFNFSKYDLSWWGFGMALKQDAWFPGDSFRPDAAATTIARFHIIRRFRVTLWLPLSLIVLVLMFMLWRKVHHRRRCLRMGLCLKCQYDLRGSPGPLCSECGLHRDEIVPKYATKNGICSK